MDAATIKVKHGWISRFYSAETPRSELPKCLSQLPASEIATGRFVKINYRHVRLMLIEVAELPADQDPRSIHLGDHVELIPQDCDAGRLSRITQFLK